MPQHSMPDKAFHPVASRPSQPATRASVFDDLASATEALGAATCPRCLGQIPFRAADVGRLLACPACPGIRVRAGQSLLDETADALPALLEQPYRVLLPPPRRRLLGKALAALLVIGSMAATGAFGWLILRSSPSGSNWLNWEAVAADEGREADGVREAAAAAAELPPPDISIEAIAALEIWSDRQKALVQAQVWLQILLDHQVADIRTERLREIIGQLEEELRPSAQPPPAFLREFRESLDRARESLAAGDLDSAGDAVGLAEKLLQEHPNELAPFGRSFLTIKQRYERMRLQIEGKQRIAELLTAAERQVSDDPTAAAEAMAEAMFLALGTPLEAAEFEERNAQVKRLQRELQFSRGKRAVADAQRCQREGDLQARDAQLDVALALLPDLPADDVTDLLKEARELRGQAIAAPQGTDFGRDLEYRAAYEYALEYYGRRDGLGEFARRCDAARLRLEASRQPDAGARQNLDRLLLGALEFAVSDLLLLPPASDELPRGMVQVREALAAAAAWQQDAKYRYVQQAVVSKEDEVAGAVIVRAQRRARAGLKADLETALNILPPALSLGGVDSRHRAQQLHDEWQQEFSRLDRLDDMQIAWDRLAVLSRGGNHLEAWRGLDEFEESYPDSPRSEQIPAVRTRLRPLVDQRVAELDSALVGFQQKEDWPKFREAVEMLSHAPLNDQQQQRLDSLQYELAELDRRAETLYASTESARKMRNETQVLELQEMLREALALNPHHAPAAALLAQARDKALSFAQGWMFRARRVGPRNPSLYRQFLERVIALVPEEKLGMEARQLLAELEQSPEEGS